MLTIVYCPSINGGRLGRARIIVGFTTNYATSAYHYGEVYSMQYYVIKFVCDMRQVNGFLRALRFPPTIKMTATI